MNILVMSINRVEPLRVSAVVDLALYQCAKKGRANSYLKSNVYLLTDNKEKHNLKSDKMNYFVHNGYF